MHAEPSLNGLSRVLAAISTLMLLLALNDRQGEIVVDGYHLGVALILAFTIYIFSGEARHGMGRSLTVLCFTALVLLSFSWNVVQRANLLWGQPFEIQLALALRNMMLGLVAKRTDPQAQQYGALASCFLALFSILWFMHLWTVVALIIYTIVGMWWLMGVYWDRLSGCFLTQEEIWIPWKPLAAAGLGVAGLLLLPQLANGRNFTTAIQGYLPSSGGTRWKDEFAYGGVGDGPQMVSARENANSFGPIESELFLESQMPSLYDCFSEFSEEPPKPPKKGRAIPLAPSMMQQNHQKQGVNEQAGREFNAVRQLKKDSPAVSDLRSRALLQVAGRVPVHLGLRTYDLWNGHTLSTSSGSPQRRLYFDNTGVDGRPWVRYTDAFEDELLTYRDHHELRIINLKTDRVPSPPGSIGVHLDKMHTESLFTVAEDGMLSLNMDFVPQLTVIHVESLQRSADSVPHLPSCSLTPKASGTRIAELARAWTSGCDNDWQKIEAICERLRCDYVLDAKHMTPPGVDDAAAHFLFNSQRGPDYLFATSAALLVRSLGYEARVVSGFYANPQHYDRQSRLTSVYADDAHFWVEVLASALGNRQSDSQGKYHWLAIDPSPGYQVLLAPEPLWSQLLSHVALAWGALKRNALPLLIWLLACSLAWFKRTAIFDLLITSWWELDHRRGGVRHRVISTLRLLDLRSYVRGDSYAKGASMSCRYMTAHSHEGDADAWRTAFRDLANWALYGEGVPLELLPEEVDLLCRQAVAAAYRSSPMNQINTSSQIVGRTV